METVFVPCRPSDPGIGTMFGGWLTEYEGRTYLVDCGVADGSREMVAEIRARLGGRRLDYLLLTHIHLDHAGGLDEVLAAWPDIEVVVHEAGIKHLANPKLLIDSTLKVMGPVMAEVYGRPAPVDRGRLIGHRRANLPGLTVLETPGHAPHHLSFILGPTIFVGEAAGCPDLLGGRLNFRPASPPRFFPREAWSSVALLRREPERTAYFGHCHQPLPYRRVLEGALRQMDLWAELLWSPEAAVRAGESAEDHLDRLAGLVLARDPDFPALAELSPVEQAQELPFLLNCIWGFIEAREEEVLSPTGTNGRL